MLQKIDPSYTGTIEWSQPKNNSIFTTLNADIKSANHIYSMTLIQDGNQIQTKMLDTGNLLNFIPKEWAEGEGPEFWRTLLSKALNIRKVETKHLPIMLDSVLRQVLSELYPDASF